MNSYSSSQMRRVTVTPRPLCTSFIPQIPQRKWCADLYQTYPCTGFYLRTHCAPATYCPLAFIGAGYQIRTGDNCLEGSDVTTTPILHFYTAYSAAIMLLRERSRLFNLDTIRGLPPFFSNLSSLSKAIIFFVSISLCVIILNFLLLVLLLLP